MRSKKKNIKYVYFIVIAKTNKRKSVISSGFVSSFLDAGLVFMMSFIIKVGTHQNCKSRTRKWYYSHISQQINHTPGNNSERRRTNITLSTSFRQQNSSIIQNCWRLSLSTLVRKLQIALQIYFGNQKILICLDAPRSGNYFKIHDHRWPE